MRVSRWILGITLTVGTALAPNEVVADVGPKTLTSDGIEFEVKN